MRNYIRYFVVILCILGFSVKNYALTQSNYSVYIKMNGVTLNKVADELTRQTGLVFSYSQQVGKIQIAKVDVGISGSGIEPILKKVFEGTDVNYIIHANNVDLVQKVEQQENQQVKQSVNNPSVRKKIRITGCVTDKADNQPLIGVVVRIKSKPQVGNSTDLDGLYLIEAYPEDILQFVYMGYDDVEVPVNNMTEINVSMKMNNEVLEEATVVGFGVQKKISVIGSQQSISTADIKVPVANVTNSLAGRVAGVVSIQRSGQPGYDDANVNGNQKCSDFGNSECSIFGIKTTVLLASAVQ